VLTFGIIDLTKLYKGGLVMEEKNKIRIFEEKQVRTKWDEENEKWWFSIVDICEILAEASNPRRYWSDLKSKLREEGSELYDKIVQLKMLAHDGKMRLTDVADTEQVLRLIQSIPSKKAEPFKMWLAKTGSERLDEMVDPEQSIERAIQNYRRLGYSENWINQRIRSIEVRKALTDEWDKAGVKQGKEYAVLTDLMTETWSGMKTKDYKKHKGLKKENLRDNMTNTELVLNMLAEVATTDISFAQQPTGFNQSKNIAVRGASVAKNARKQIELETGKTPISSLNAKNLGQIEIDTLNSKI